MPDVRLVPLEPERFESFISGTIERYAEELDQAGYARGEAAKKKSKDDTQKLLPKGIDTPVNHFYLVRDSSSDEELGGVWLKSDEEPRRSVFIFSVFLEERYRGMGYGKATMARIEETSRGLGAETVDLHVFGFNERAIKLYKSSGYVVRSLNMGKEL
ncbi:MAG: GNAT family N-acetyltransferase [Methanomassiliicoccales archaeon]|nr:GNAT family N-acetyltransferase [Methanomassiliicoccales archaeon]